MDEEAIPLQITQNDGSETSVSTTSSTLDYDSSWRTKIETKNKRNVRVEDFPQGYPRYSAVLASDNSFQIWRRFSILRTRLLLLKQDELSQLEKQLEDIDARDEELFPLSLGSRRSDPNEERRKVLNKIDTALNDYDSLLDRQQQVLSLEPTLYQAIQNLQNWHTNNGSMATDETEYLKREDLFNPFGNISLSYRLLDAIGKYSFYKKAGRDNSVLILSHSSRKYIRVFQAAITAVLLFTPVILCNFVSNLITRTFIIIASTAIFIAVLSFIAQKKMRFFELVIAGTTYATVLVVFISGTNGINN